MSATLRSRQEKILFTHRRDLVHHNAETKKKQCKKGLDASKETSVIEPSRFTPRDWIQLTGQSCCSSLGQRPDWCCGWSSTEFCRWGTSCDNSNINRSLTLTRINSWRVWNRNTTCIEWHRCYEHLRPISTAISCAWKSKKNRVEWILFIRRKNPGCAKMSWEDGC